VFRRAPAHLPPFVSPLDYGLVVDVRAATARGLDAPASGLRQADQIIG
jgi:hypothetical protein